MERETFCNMLEPDEVVRGRRAPTQLILVYYPSALTGPGHHRACAVTKDTNRRYTTFTQAISIHWAYSTA